MATETKALLTLGAMKAGFGEALVAARDANVNAIIYGASLLVMACHPAFPRDPADAVRTVKAVQDEIREMGEQYLAKGKSGKYALAADALTVGQAIIKRFKPGKGDATDAAVPDLFRLMSQAEKPADAVAYVKAALGSWYGVDAFANVSGMMAAIRGEGTPKATRQPKAEAEPVAPVATVETVEQAVNAAPTFGVTEARKVIAPALARLIKAGDRDALIAILADVEAALGQCAEAQAPAEQAKAA
jgi:hypothetical protein